MEIRVLQYFLAVAREEGITKASEALHITQPTLSRQLAQLEEELGVTLFERGSRKIRLTNEGMLLRRRAEEILQLVDKTKNELAEQEEFIEGTVSLGCGEMASMSDLSDLCVSFRQRYPNVYFDLYTATADVVRERIERGVTDAGLLLEPVDMEKFEFVRLSRPEHWCVLARSDDALAKKESVTAFDLENLPLCLPARLNVQNELANWFGERFARLRVVMTSNLSTNAAVMALKGIAYPVVIDGSTPFWDQKMLKSIPLSPDLTATAAFAWKREQPFSPAATAFIHYAKCFLGMNEAYKESI